MGTVSWGGGSWHRSSGGACASGGSRARSVPDDRQFSEWRHHVLAGEVHRGIRASADRPADRRDRGPADAAAPAAPRTCARDRCDRRADAAVAADRRVAAHDRGERRPRAAQRRRTRRAGDRRPVRRCPPCRGGIRRRRSIDAQPRARPLRCVAREVARTAARGVGRRRVRRTSRGRGHRRHARPRVRRAGAVDRAAVAELPRERAGTRRAAAARGREARAARDARHEHEAAAARTGGRGLRGRARADGDPAIRRRRPR